MVEVETDTDVMDEAVLALACSPNVPIEFSPGDLTEASESLV